MRVTGSGEARIYHPDLSVLLDFTIGEFSTVHAPVWIGDGVMIGDRCKIQAFAFIPQGIQIGNDCFIGPHVCFTNDRHPPSLDWEETLVEDGVSIGAGAVILPGLILGKGSIIGAGSVVTQSVLRFTTVAGNPAREI
jgi:UDP-2-acetamido-3-amino-2,3-dideoxy-glucuronate N-acetyltransferase